MVDRLEDYRALTICSRCWTVVAIDGEINTQRALQMCSHLGPVVNAVPASQLEGAVDLIREIGHMAGAKATGADARAMAKRAREFVASLDQPGGR